MYLWIALSFVIKLVLERRLGFLKHYPYFNTPLIDLRQLLEAISNHKLTGAYFIDENAINQPLLLVRLYHLLFSTLGVFGIKALLFGCDLVTVLVQTSTLAQIYRKRKQSKALRYLQLLIIFNPLNLISPAVHNLQVVNNMLVAICAWSVVANGWEDGSVMTDLISGGAIYLDPCLIYVIGPVRSVAEVVESRGKRVFSAKVLKSLAIWLLVMGGLVILSGDWQADLRNYRNILQVRDHSENIGLFWYLFVELFRQHVSFY